MAGAFEPGKMGKASVRIVVDPTKTFADEWGVRDLVLTRSEAAKVRRIAERFGLPIGHHPTGRTVQLLLQHIEALALAGLAAGDRRYKRPFQAARQALGKGVN